MSRIDYECPLWVAKAQERLLEHAAKCFSAWLETKPGRNWQTVAHKPPVIRRYVHHEIPYNSPYAHGFSLPDYHHDLIRAIHEGDEETAKFLMLAHFV